MNKETYHFIHFKFWGAEIELKAIIPKEAILKKRKGDQEHNKGI